MPMVMEIPRGIEIGAADGVDGTQLPPFDQNNHLGGDSEPDHLALLEIEMYLTNPRVEYLMEKFKAEERALGQLANYDTQLDAA